MNKLSATIGILLLIGLVSANGVCTKHATDGSLGDWGLNAIKNSANWGLNSTWLPNAGVQYIIEDNYNPKYAGGSNPAGVHIMGIGSSFVFYDEPKVLTKDGILVAEPYGHEEFDNEAFYFDQDSGCIYITIITSEAPDAKGDLAPSDLALNMDNDPNTGQFGYEYGVKLESYHAPLTLFGLYSNPDWQIPPYVPQNRPSYFKSGSYLGQVKGVYQELKDDNGNGVYDRGYPNYIVQLAIPKSSVGNPSNLGFDSFHISEYCGNDHIPAPEFPFILVPLAITAIAPVLGYYISKRQ